MSSAKSRLRRVERRVRAGSCPGCGLPADGSGFGRIVYDDIPEGAEEFCPACGRALWTVIKVVCEGDEEGEGG